MINSENRSRNDKSRQELQPDLFHIASSLNDIKRIIIINRTKSTRFIPCHRHFRLKADGADMLHKHRRGKKNRLGSWLSHTTVWETLPFGQNFVRNISTPPWRYIRVIGSCDQQVKFRGCQIPVMRRPRVRARIEKPGFRLQPWPQRAIVPLSLAPEEFQVERQAP